MSIAPRTDDPVRSASWVRVARPGPGDLGQFAVEPRHLLHDPFLARPVLVPRAIGTMRS